MNVFEILRFCRIIFQFSTFSSVLQRFSLLHVLGWLVRKTFVKQTRMSKTEKLYDKNSKSLIHSFTIWNLPLVLYAHQISAPSEHYTNSTTERNFTLEITYDIPHLPWTPVFFLENLVDPGLVDPWFLFCRSDPRFGGPGFEGPGFGGPQVS